MTPEQQCLLAKDTIETVQVQLGLPVSAPEFVFHDTYDQTWFSCPEHNDLGRFSGSIVSLLAEVLDVMHLLNHGGQDHG